MDKEIRIQKILKLLETKQSLTTGEIIEEVGVSPSTVRSDIREMHSRKIIERSHGKISVFYDDSNIRYNSLEFRKIWNIDIKMDLAKKVLDNLVTTKIIFLDESISALCVAKEIKFRKMNIDIVTNSLLIMQELANENNINIIGLGGYFINSLQAFTGKNTIENFLNYNIPVAILGSYGLCEMGTLETHPALFDIKKTIVQSVKTSYLVADISKFSYSGGELCLKWSDIDIFCTNYNDDQIFKNFSGKII